MVYERWKYKANVNVGTPSATAGALSKIVIPCLPGMDIYFRDIRFAAAGKALPYWIEESTAGTSATVLISLPAASTRINLRYGYGPAATETSISGLGALFFDNLEGGTIQAAKWDTKNNTFGDGVISIKTDQKYNNYSLGIDEASNSGGSPSYDQCHALIKILLTSVPTGTTFFIRNKARRWKTTSSATAFCGFGYGGTSDSAAELYNLPVDDAWHEYLTKIERTGTSAWTFTIYQDGTQVYTGSKTKTFSTNFLYGIQTRKSPGYSNYVRIDNVLAWTGTAPSLTLGPHYEASQPTAGALSMEGARLGVGMRPGYSLRDQPITAQGSLQTAGAYSTRNVTGGAVTLGMTAAAETHDTKIIINAGLGLHVAADPLKYYLEIDAALKTAGTFTRKDYLHFSEMLYTLTNYGAVKFETLSDYPAIEADVSKSITDAVWQLQTTFVGPNAPGPFYPLHHEAKDHNGVTRHLFTGIIPQIDKEIGSTGIKTKVTAYDYGWYLSSQYIPDNARTMEVTTAWWSWGRASWQAWINYLLEDTGITAYRIRTGPSVLWKQFIFSNKTTKKEAIDQISEYCGYIFEVKWRDYGTADNPDWRPVAYWVPQAEIDDTDDGLDIPAPVTLSWPDPHLVDLPTITTAPEERINRVRIIGSDPDGNYYSQTYETSAVTAGTELPREYMEESSALTSQSQVNTYASAMLTYFTRPAVTVTMKFIDRFDLQLYQKIKFGAGFPQELYSLTDGTDSINYLRIVGIKYHTGPANNYVEVTAVYDHPIIIVRKRHNVLLPNFFTEVTARVQKGIDSQVKSVVGTVESISSDKKTAVIVSEFGNRIRVRLQ